MMTVVVLGLALVGLFIGALMALLVYDRRPRQVIDELEERRRRRAALNGNVRNVHIREFAAKAPAPDDWFPDGEWT